MLLASILKSLPVILLVIYMSSCCAKNANEVDTTAYREKVKRMFYHAYEGYLKYAYPYDELKPLTCKGHDTWGSYSLTLIDAMDTLAVMGNYSEFRRIANLVIDKGENAFDMDINVSVFETNIRIVGGLISAHLLMKRAGMQLEEGWPCSGPLLRMADTIARKLLPAFDTPTGMPYGTVNLRNGVPKGETSVTCTAGVGTFIVEFGTLSRLTGDPIFEKTAVRAIRSLWKYRSSLGLLGNHIDVKTGKWTAQDAGIGGGVDSYFEYLVKGSILFNLPELTHLFREFEVSIKKYLKKDDWYMWAQMTKGTITLPMFTSLDAFWPSIQMMLGDVDAAMKTLHNFQMVWREFGFTPEYYNIPKSEPHKGREGYPLRPELIESIMYLYRGTKDPSLLQMGVDIVETIERQARTACGYATIKDVRDHRLDDRMESFFLAETAKYLYLLFDTENFIHNNGSHGQVVETPSGSCVIEAGGYMFNTEAHPIDLAAVHCCSAKKLEEDKILEDFHSNLDLLSLLNLVDSEDEFLGMTDWRSRKNKKENRKNYGHSDDFKLKEEMSDSQEEMKREQVSSTSNDGDDVNDDVDDDNKNSNNDNVNKNINDNVNSNNNNDYDNINNDYHHQTDDESKIKSVEISQDIIRGDDKQTSQFRNDKVPGVNLEVSLPSGPLKPDEDKGNIEMKSNHKMLTETNLSEMQKNVVKILMESLHVDTEDMNYADIALKLASEFKDTKYEKIAKYLVEQLFLESMDEKRKAKEEGGDVNLIDQMFSNETINVIPADSVGNEADLEKLLSDLIVQREGNNGSKHDVNLNKGVGVDNQKSIEDEGDDSQNSSSSSDNSLSQSKSTEFFSDEFEEDDSNPALIKFKQHLENQEKEEVEILESKRSDFLEKASFLENRRVNILSLTKKFIKIFTSISTGKGFGLEGTEEEAESNRITQDGSPSLNNLYAVLGNQTLRYFDNPGIMHCPAQPFHSRLSVNGEFLVNE